MKVEYSGPGRVSDFVAYCKKHKVDLDDSFLYDDQLQTFNPMRIIRPISLLIRWET